MRLTKDDKQAFIKSVMDDVPRVNYEQQVRDLCMAWAKGRMPPNVRNAYTTNPEYFDNTSITTPTFKKDNSKDGWDRYLSVYAPVPSRTEVSETATPELWADLTVLCDKNTAQHEALDALEAKVRGAIFSCATLKKAQELLPEFSKYLPADRDGTGVGNLPAVANLVTDLMNLGWPKGSMTSP